MTEVAAQALLTADRVIREDNGKHSVIGIFSHLVADQFPASMAPWSIYVAVANVSKGKHAFAVNIKHDGSDSVPWSAGGEIEVEAPGGVEMSFPVALTFPVEGKYTVSFHVDRDVALTREILVTRRSQ